MKLITALLIFVLGCSHAQIDNSNRTQRISIEAASQSKIAFQVEHFEIKKKFVAFEGKKFGEVGTYVALLGVATILINPFHPLNQKINDLSLAPKRPDGWVEYSIDVNLLRPENPKAARRVLVYDVANRGRRTSHATYLNEGNVFETAAGAGKGFLMDQGYTIVWSGWQSDIPLASKGPLLGTNFPTVKTATGQTLEGLSREEFIFDELKNPVEARLTYPAARRDDSKILLRAKQRQTDPWKTVTSWKWKDDSRIEIDRPKEFDAGAIYEFIYVAKDPVVSGLGFASVRDIVTFLKFETSDLRGTENPLVDLRQGQCLQKSFCEKKESAIFESSIIVGVSQAGRFIRDYIYQDFNVDANRQMVFNGAMPIAAGARRAWVNERFAQPGRWSREHEDHFQIGDQFPFSYRSEPDPIGGTPKDGLLNRCAQTETCPKLMHVDGSHEFWQGRSSLITDRETENDVKTSTPHLRLYLLSSLSHVYFIPVKYETPEKCLMKANQLQPQPIVRALFKDLVDWVATDLPPPESVWPRQSTRELVKPSDKKLYRLPDFSSLGLSSAPVVNPLAATDYGKIPPEADQSKVYPILVPAVDQDGNDKPGIQTGDRAVPVGTHLPWNFRKNGFAPGATCGGYGSFIPFALSKKERQKNHDQRLSLNERYQSRNQFLMRVQKQSQILVKKRLLLEQEKSFWQEWAEKQWPLK